MPEKMLYCTGRTMPEDTILGSGAYRSAIRATLTKSREDRVYRSKPVPIVPKKYQRTRLAEAILERFRDTQLRDAVLTSVFEALVPDVEVRIFVESNDEMVFAFSRVLEVMVTMGMLDDDKSIKAMDDLSRPPTLELLNGSAVVFNFHKKKMRTG